MATSPYKPEQLLAELEEVALSVEQDKERGAEVRANGRALTNMANKLAELLPTLQELGASGDIPKTVDMLAEWAKVMDPRATTTWDKASVTDKLTKLQSFRTIEALSEAQVERLDAVTEALKSVGSGTGERAPRKPQPRLEGRPETVGIFGPDGVRFSTQTGNVANSASNLKNRAVQFIKAATDGDVDSEDQKGLLAAAKEVAEGRSASETYEGITFAVVEAD